jgi:hypothetical protein
MSEATVASQPGLKTSRGPPWRPSRRGLFPSAFPGAKKRFSGATPTAAQCQARPPGRLQGQLDSIPRPSLTRSLAPGFSRPRGSAARHAQQRRRSQSGLPFRARFRGVHNLRPGLRGRARFLLIPPSASGLSGHGRNPLGALPNGLCAASGPVLPRFLRLLPRFLRSKFCCAGVAEWPLCCLGADGARPPQPRAGILRCSLFSGGISLAGPRSPGLRLCNARKSWPEGVRSESV